jgi:hypothetical protein
MSAVKRYGRAITANLEELAGGSFVFASDYDDLLARLQRLTKWATHAVYCEKSLSKGTECQCGLDLALGVFRVSGPDLQWRWNGEKLVHNRIAETKFVHEVPLSREQAIDIARECAAAKPQSYYADPFEPHEWVIDAIMTAARARKPHQ